MEYPTMAYQNTYFMEFLTNTSYGNATKVRRLNALFHHPLNIWCIPVNHGYNHWLYLTMDTTRKEIGQHDSLTTHTSHNYTSHLCHTLAKANQGNWTSEQVSTPRQHNSFDCGIYVLAHIHKQVSGNSRGPTGNPSWAQLLTVLNTGTLPDTLYQPILNQTQVGLLDTTKDITRPHTPIKLSPHHISSQTTSMSTTEIPPQPANKLAQIPLHSWGIRGHKTVLLNTPLPPNTNRGIRTTPAKH